MQKNTVAWLQVCSPVLRLVTWERLDCEGRQKGQAVRIPNSQSTMRRGLNVNVSSHVKPKYKAVICSPSWWRCWLLNSSMKTHRGSKLWKFSPKLWSRITTFSLRFGNFLVLRICQWRKLGTYIESYLYKEQEYDGF